MDDDDDDYDDDLDDYDDDDDHDDDADDDVMTTTILLMLMIFFQQVRCDRYHGFWEKIVKFIRQEFNPVTNVVKLTLVFSVISYYMALKVNHQNASYWGTQVNATNVVN